MLKDPHTAFELTPLRRLLTGDAWAHTVVDIREAHPTVQTRLRDTEIQCDLRERRVAPTGDSDHVTTEHQRECLRHSDHPLSEDNILTRQESTELGADPSL